ncbi:WXG100 family type VII secretion target [Nocardia sp. NPDC049149]|uniref:WXG100 family type VII secretion target n=1 Tax=Nocardia sp. NPDC049149 TaxID=3364315 RepID=UPI00371F463E
MTGPIIVDHARIEAALSEFATVTNLVDGKILEADQNKQKLLEDFKGAGATGYQGDMNKWTQDSTDLKASMVALKNAVAAASQDFHQTDLGAAQLFNHH